MIPTFDVGRVITFVKTIMIVTILWAAFKALLIGAISILVPFAIYKAFNLMAQKSYEFGNTLTTGTAWEGAYIDLVGLGAWMGERLQLQACFQILASFVVIRYTLSFFKKS